MIEMQSGQRFPLSIFPEQIKFWFRKLWQNFYPAQRLNIMTVFRKYLSEPGLLSIIHKQFSKIPDPREFTKNVAISIGRRDNILSSICTARWNSRYISVNAYFASVTADFLRRKLLEQKKSFTFETVMSSPDKIELLRSAQNMGYRTYLYYVATSDPEINIERIQSRVKMGGHAVPEFGQGRF